MLHLNLLTINDCTLMVLCFRLVDKVNVSANIVANIAELILRWLIFGTCRYLSALISQSFLDIGSVSRILDGIMKLCLQFCWNIENRESSANTVELEHITEVMLLLSLQYCQCMSFF